MPRRNDRNRNQHLLQHLLFAEFDVRLCLRNWKDSLSVEFEKALARRQKDSRSDFEARVYIESLGSSSGFLRMHFGNYVCVALGLGGFYFVRCIPIDEGFRHFFPLRLLNAVVTNSIAFDAIFPNKLKAAIAEYELF